MKQNFLRVAILISVLGAMSAQAGLEVIENIGDGTEKEWPRKPAEVVTEDPSLAGAPAGVGKKDVLISQTFTPKRSFTLNSFMIRYIGEPGGKYGLRIQEVPEKAAAIAYAEGKDLFPQSLTFVTTADTKQERRLMEFRFTGGDKIELKRGVTYAVELLWIEGPSLNWQRRAADVYDRGMSYIGRTQLSGNDDARDLSLALFAN